MAAPAVCIVFRNTDSSSCTCKWSGPALSKPRRCPQDLYNTDLIGCAVRESSACPSTPKSQFLGLHTDFSCRKIEDGCTKRRGMWRQLALHFDLALYLEQSTAFPTSRQGLTPTNKTCAEMQHRLSRSWAAVKVNKADDPLRMMRCVAQVAACFPFCVTESTWESRQELILPQHRQSFRCFSSLHLKRENSPSMDRHPMQSRCTLLQDILRATLLRATYPGWAWGHLLKNGAETSQSTGLKKGTCPTRLVSLCSGFYLLRAKNPSPSKALTSPLLFCGQ